MRVCQFPHHGSEVPIPHSMRMPIPTSRIRGANSSFYEGANFLITDQECQFPRGCQFSHHGSGVPISYPMRMSILASWIRECQFSIPSLPIPSTDEGVPISSSRIRGANSHEGANFLIMDQECQFPIL